MDGFRVDARRSVSQRLLWCLVLAGLELMGLLNQVFGLDFGDCAILQIQ